MTSPAISVLIPAAGGSERLGQTKQLVNYKNKPLIENVVNTATSISPREIIVITGANASVIKEAVSLSHVRWVNNQQWTTGMGGSIALGAASINPESAGLMILLCDQWRIRDQDLKVLTETWYSNPERIVVAEADNHYMPPAIFPSSCFKQLQKLEGNQGARSFIAAHPEMITPVPLKNAAFDLDTQTQLNQLKKSV